MTDQHWLHERVNELAEDVGHLRHTLQEGSIADHRARRVANHVYAIAAALRPSAADIAATVYPGDPETIDAAIDQVEHDRRQLLRTLGYRNHT